MISFASNQSRVLVAPLSFWVFWRDILLQQQRKDALYCEYVPVTSVSWYLYRICDSALRLLHLLNYIVKSNDLNMHQLRLVSCPLLICQMRLELNTWHCKLVKQEYLVLYNLGWKNTCPVLVVGMEPMFMCTESPHRCHWYLELHESGKIEADCSGWKFLGNLNKESNGRCEPKCFV